MKIHNIMPLNNKIKSYILSTTLVLSSIGLCSCDSRIEHEKMIAQQDSIRIANQIKTLESNLEIDNYEQYGINPKDNTAKEDLRQLKELEIKQKKMKLKNVYNDYKMLMLSKIFFLFLSIVAISLKLVDFIKNNIKNRN